MRDIVRTSGVRGLGSGFWATCARDVPSFGVYFFMYELLAKNLRKVIAKKQRRSEELNKHDKTFRIGGGGGGRGDSSQRQTARERERERERETYVDLVMYIAQAT